MGRPDTVLRRLPATGWAALLLVTLAVVMLVLLPLARMVRTVWTEGSGDFGSILERPGLGQAVANSILLALAVTLVAVPIGCGMALLLRRPNLPARKALQLAVLLPVLVPDFVLAYSWLRAYGRAGFSDDVAGVAWEGIQGPVGVTVVLAVNAVPVAYLIVAVGLAARAEPALDRAARVAGAGPLTVLRTITLPLLRPALATAAVLVFALTLSSFAIPQVMGSPAGFSTVTTRIYADLARSSEPAAFVEAIMLALLLMLIAVLVVAPVDLLLGPRLRVVRTSTTDPATKTGASRVSDWWAAAAVACFVVLAVVVPLTGVVATALTKAVGLPPVSVQLDHGQLPVRPLGPERGGAGAYRLPGPGGRLSADRARRLRGGAGAHAHRPRHRIPGDSHVRAARFHAGDRPADHLRQVDRRHAPDHPARLPRQAVGVRAPTDLWRPGPVAAR